MKIAAIRRLTALSRRCRHAHETYHCRLDDATRAVGRITPVGTTRPSHDDATGADLVRAFGDEIRVDRALASAASATPPCIARRVGGSRGSSGPASNADYDHRHDLHIHACGVEGIEGIESGVGGVGEGTDDAAAAVRAGLDELRRYHASVCVEAMKLECEAAHAVVRIRERLATAASPSRRAAVAAAVEEVGHQAAAARAELERLEAQHQSHAETVASARSTAGPRVDSRGRAPQAAACAAAAAKKQELRTRDDVCACVAANTARRDSCLGAARVESEQDAAHPTRFRDARRGVVDRCRALQRAARRSAEECGSLLLLLREAKDGAGGQGGGAQDGRGSGGANGANRVFGVGAAGEVAGLAGIDKAMNALGLQVGQLEARLAASRVDVQGALGRTVMSAERVVEERERTWALEAAAKMQPGFGGLDWVRVDGVRLEEWQRWP